MEKRFLEDCLAKGISLIEIGEIAGKPPGTVGYWVKKYGLVANGRERYAPRGAITRASLEELIKVDATLRQMADALDRSVRTVCYWLERYGLERRPHTRRRVKAGPGAPKRMDDECKHHGRTEFILEGRGYYRCLKCRANAVAKRRRKVKQILVDEAGGECAICGYSRCISALHFHHVDPTAKEFHLGHQGATRSLARSRTEARKCVLLCANCHAEVEDKARDTPGT
jgi:hypothetical protein